LKICQGFSLRSEHLSGKNWATIGTPPKRTLQWSSRRSNQAEADWFLCYFAARQWWQPISNDHYKADQRFSLKQELRVFILTGSEKLVLLIVIKRASLNEEVVKSRMKVVGS